MDNVKIEMLLPRHARALSVLTRNALRDNPTAFTSDHLQFEQRPLSAVIDHLTELENAPGFRLGAFTDANELVGTIRLAPRSGVKVRHAADILFTCVRADYQRRGIGSRLLERTIDEARAISDLQQLELCVSNGAAHAIRLYRKFGFEQTGLLKRQIFCNNRYYDLLTMWRGL